MGCKHPTSGLPRRCTQPNAIDSCLLYLREGDCWQCLGLGIPVGAAMLNSARDPRL